MALQFYVQLIGDIYFFQTHVYRIIINTVERHKIRLISRRRKNDSNVKRPVEITIANQFGVLYCGTIILRIVRS